MLLVATLIFSMVSAAAAAAHPRVSQEQQLAAFRQAKHESKAETKEPSTSSERTIKPSMFCPYFDGHTLSYNMTFRDVTGRREDVTWMPRGTVPFERTMVGRAANIHTQTAFGSLSFRYPYEYKDSHWTDEAAWGFKLLDLHLHYIDHACLFLNMDAKDTYFFKHIRFKLNFLGYLPYAVNPGEEYCDGLCATAINITRAFSLFPRIMTPLLNLNVTISCDHVYSPDSWPDDGCHNFLRNTAKIEALRPMIMLRTRRMFPTDFPDHFPGRPDPGVDCNPDYHCCGTMVTVHLTDLGFPEGTTPSSFDTLMCGGQCVADMHYSVLMKWYDPAKPELEWRPACQPVAYLPLRVLQPQPVTGKYVVATYPRMIVTDCGCTVDPLRLFGYTNSTAFPKHKRSRQVQDADRELR